MRFGSAKRNLFIEFKEDACYVLDTARGIEIPLQRDVNARVSAACIQNTARALRDFLEIDRTASVRCAYCSIPSRGVAIRRLAIPTRQQEDVHRLLKLQLEAQLPISPDELAWGCAPLPQSDGATGMQDFLVVAVKKELIEDYSAILAGANLSGNFTIAALARRALCDHSAELFSLLEVSRTRIEIAAFDSRGPLSLRTSPWDGAAPTLKDSLITGDSQKLYLFGASAQTLSGLGIPIEVLDGYPAEGRTTANSGLERLIRSGAEPPFLDSHQLTEKTHFPIWRWACLAVALGVGALGLRYAETIVYGTRLERKLSAIASYRSRLPNVAHEFSFLNFIKTNQPPYLDVLAELAVAAPAGIRLDNVTLTRRGDVTFRGAIGDGQALSQFRAKLIASGFFSRIVIDEQTPSSDGHKTTFRASGSIKEEGSRKPLSFPSKSTTNTLSTPLAGSAAQK